MTVYELQVKLPDHFKLGDLFAMEDDTSLVYMVEDNGFAEYPVRQGIAGYLWYLRLFGNKYLQELKGWEPNNDKTKKG